MKIAFSSVSFRFLVFSYRTAGEGGGYLFNSLLPLPPASLAFRYQPGDYCRELTSANS